MQIFKTDRPMEWGKLDLPMMGLTQDWFEKPLNPPLAFSVALDPEKFWFVASRTAPHHSHPDSAPNVFLAELWKYDVAELFLGNPATGEYIELNLAPNGAWWAAKFSAPRILCKEQPKFSDYIKTYQHAESNNSWTAAMNIQLSFLLSEIGLNKASTANAAAILNSPQQTFHSAHKLPGTEPNFHQPEHFPPLRIEPFSPSSP